MTVMVILVILVIISDFSDDKNDDNGDDYLDRIIISQLLKAPLSSSLVSKHTEPNVQEWVGEVNGCLPEDKNCTRSLNEREKMCAMTFQSQEYQKG